MPIPASMSFFARSPAAPAVVRNIEPLVAGHLMGSLLHSFLFGALLVQTYIYRVCFLKDSLRVKCVVYSLFLMMLLRTFFNLTNTQYWFGSGFGHIERFEKTLYMNVAQPVLAALITLLVQTFFSYRIFTLKRRAWPLSALVILISMTQAAGCIGRGILWFYDGNNPSAPAHTLFGQLVRIWLSSGVFADAVITTTTTYLLLTAKSEERRTQNIVTKIIWLIIEANTLSAAVAVAGLVTFYVYPGTSYWVCPTMTLPAVSANSLLATLNHRALLRLDTNTTHFEPCDPMHFDLSVICMGPAHPEANRLARSGNRLARSAHRLARSATLDSTGSIPEMTFAPPGAVEGSKEWQGKDNNTNPTVENMYTNPTV
ncbi:hypothetical protein C8R43DRAFT_975981 [Mycena crocata]|nr:hypothetical protein C8R43DRAFT_975981 [Mycena crocata]